MTKIVLVVLVVVVGGLLGWLHWSPRHADRQLGAAVLANDTATIAKLVRFPTVRNQFSVDVQAARARVGRRPNMDSLEQAMPISAWMLMRPRHSIVDESATPGGFIFATNFAYWVPKVEGQVREPLWAKFVEFPTTFEVGRLVESPPNSDTARFVLRRDGLAWKVEQVRLYALCRSSCTDAGAPDDATSEAELIRALTMPK